MEPRHHGAANVLITAAGRRTSLVEAFATAAHARDGSVYAGDVDALAPALLMADVALRTLRTHDPGYVADLLDVVERHDVTLLVPTIDPDLSILAEAKEAFGALGCQVAISTPDFVRIALDKHETGQAFSAAGIRVPRSWLPPFDSFAGLPERLFIKPRTGSGSQDAFATTRGSIASLLPLVPNPIVQELLGGPEITIDALLDLGGRPLHYVPRRRIRTFAGESVQGVTLKHDRAIEEWVEQVLVVCSSLGAAGPLTLQAFLTKDGPTLTEINARFGGGFPLALEAGAAYPAWLLDMVLGTDVRQRLGEYEADVFMTRYHVEHFTRSPRW